MSLQRLVGAGSNAQAARILERGGTLDDWMHFATRRYPGELRQTYESAWERGRKAWNAGRSLQENQGDYKVPAGYPPDRGAGRKAWLYQVQVRVRVPGTNTQKRPYMEIYSDTNLTWDQVRQRALGMMQNQLRDFPSQRQKYRLDDKAFLDQFLVLGLERLGA